MATKKETGYTQPSATPKKPRGRPKAEEASKQAAVRLTPDLTSPIEQLAKEFGLDNSEIIRRLLRLSLRPVASDKQLLFSPEASQPLA